MDTLTELQFRRLLIGRLVKDFVDSIQYYDFGADYELVLNEIFIEVFFIVNGIMDSHFNSKESYEKIPI